MPNHELLNSDDPEAANHVTADASRVPYRYWVGVVGLNILNNKQRELKTAPYQHSGQVGNLSRYKSVRWTSNRSRLCLSRHTQAKSSSWQPRAELAPSHAEVPASLLMEAPPSLSELAERSESSGRFVLMLVLAAVVCSARI